MDIEGGEHLLLPAMLEANATKLVDVLLWECHFGMSVESKPSTCWRLRERLQATGLKVYHEPKACPNLARSKWDCFQPLRKKANESKPLGLGAPHVHSAGSRRPK